MKYKNRLNKISLVLVVIMCMQVIIPKIAIAYPSTNASGKPINNAMSNKVGFGVYGITSNGTGVATGVTPPGMTTPQQQKEGEWRYLGYTYEDKVVSNSAYPGDYGMEGTKIGGYASTWGKLQNKSNDYNRITPALNEDSGDIKTANQIGIDYCELLEKASPDKPGAFRVWFKIPPYPGYPNGRTMYMTYVIPKNDGVPRHSFIYYREEGTNRSLLPSDETYEKYTYTLKPEKTWSVSYTAKEFQDYEFTRSITSTSTSSHFENELRGEEGKTRSGVLTYDSTNEFDVIFYYKKKSNAEITGDLITDNSNYSCESKDSSVTIKAKEQTDLVIDNAAEVKEIGAKVVSYSINGGSDVSVNKIKTSNNVKTVSTDYANIDIAVNKLDNGSNTINIKGYSYWKDSAGQIYSVNTSKDVTITKSEPGKPIAKITAPSTVWAGDSGQIIGTGSDAKDAPGKLTYKWEVLQDPQDNNINLSTVYPNIGGQVTFKKGKEKPREEGQPQEYENYDIKLKLTVTNTAGFSDTDTCTIKVETKPLDNIPPVAKLKVEPKYVRAGDEVKLDAGDSYDPDGSIEHYDWENSITNGVHGGFFDYYAATLWYEWFPEYGEQKEVKTKVTVTDNGGKRDNNSKTYYILPPTINIALNTTGTLKENRKISLSLNIDTPKHYPVKSINWNITAVDSNADVTSLRHSGELDGSTSKDILFKKKGKYKVEVTVKNEAGYTDSASTILDIQPDLAPTAKVDTVKYILRDPNNHNLATMQATDISQSIDNDYIAKRLWFYTYDANNDGNFSDDITYFLIGGKWVSKGVNPVIPTDLSNIDCGNIEKPLMQSKEVGKYDIRVVVQEEFGQPTIEEFVTGKDRHTTVSN